MAVNRFCSQVSLPFVDILFINHDIYDLVFEDSSAFETTIANARLKQCTFVRTHFANVRILFLGQDVIPGLWENVRLWDVSLDRVHMKNVYLKNVELVDVRLEYVSMLDVVLEDLRWQFASASKKTLRDVTLTEGLWEGFPPMPVRQTDCELESEDERNGQDSEEDYQSTPKEYPVPNIRER